MRKRKLLIAEIVIIAFILTLIFLPQFFGETQRAVSYGRVDNLNSFLIMKGSVISGDSASENMMKSCENIILQTYDDTENAVADILSENCDYLVTDKNTAEAVIRENKDLMIYPALMNTLTGDFEDENRYVVFRKSDYAFGITDKTLSDADQKGTIIATVTGAPYITRLSELFPNARLDYYNNYSDVFEAVASGNADYGTGFSNVVENTLPVHLDMAKVYEPFNIAGESFMASKTERGKVIITEMNEFLSEIRENGTYDMLYDKWMGSDESRYKLEECSYTGQNGELKIVTGANWPSMTFYYNNEISGFFVDIACLFCERYGYIPNITVVDLPGMLAGLANGEYDLMADLVEVTDERSSSGYFSDIIQMSVNSLYTKADEVKTESVSKAGNIVETVSEKIQRVFISQERYKMMLKGLRTTILLSALSTIIGTLLGIAVCYLRMSNNIYFEAFGRIYIKIAQGMPIVVLLLLLFYVVLSGYGISAFWVCVIGFSLDFSAYACEIFRNGIEAVDKNQKRAALALGFTGSQAFWKVVLPQGVRHMLPVYRGQLVSLVKTTSVAGYIAVQDLTKVSDLIQATTYEAILPLVTTAVIYFLLASLLVLCLKLIETRTDIERRPRIPKGVKVND